MNNIPNMIISFLLSFGFMATVTSARYVMLYVPDEGFAASQPYYADSYLSLIQGDQSPNVIYQYSDQVPSYVEPQQTPIKPSLYQLQSSDFRGQSLPVKRSISPNGGWMGNLNLHPVERRSDNEVAQRSYETSFYGMKYPYNGWKPY